MAKTGIKNSYRTHQDSGETTWDNNETGMRQGETRRDKKRQEEMSTKVLPSLHYSGNPGNLIPAIASSVYSLDSQIK